MTGPDDAGVDILERSEAFRGYFRIDRYTLRHRTYAGGWTPDVQVELFERGKTVAVLPYDPVRDTVILIEQFRIGAYAAGMEPWVIEAVAGTREASEQPEQTVHREVQEEAGCAVTDLHSIGTYLLSAGACSEACAMYVGRVDSEGVGGIHGLQEEAEDIMVKVVSADEAIAKVMNGQVPSTYGAIPLLWLASNRNDLRKTWLKE